MVVLIYLHPVLPDTAERALQQHVQGRA
jgi:hypothetical protein